MVISQSGDPKGIEPRPTLRKPLFYPLELSGRIYVNVVLDYSGDPKGIRTPDRRLRKPLLCPNSATGSKNYYTIDAQNSKYKGPAKGQLKQYEALIMDTKAG